MTRSKKYAELPPDEEIRRIFAIFVTEHFAKRSFKGVKPLLAPDITGIGCAVSEIGFDATTIDKILKADFELLSEPIHISNETFCIQRLGTQAAIISGTFAIKGSADNISFAENDFRLSAVYCLHEGKLLVSHVHMSLPRGTPQNPENIPIRRLAAALHESEEKYRLVFENAPVGVLHFDKNGIIQAANKKFLQIMGTTAEKIIGLDLMVNPDKMAMDAVKCALKGRVGYYNGYYSSITAKKTTPLKAVLSPIFSPEASIIGGIGIYEDISENKDAENRLQYQFQFERVISNISTSFVNTPVSKIDSAIENALKLSGQFFDADRCYIFILNASGTIINNTYEWCESSVDSLQKKYQNFPTENLQVFRDFSSKIIDHLHFNDVMQMPPEAAEFQKMLLEDSVASILLLPLYTNGKVIGCFGYDCIKSAKSWSLEDISLLKVVGEIFSSALARKEAEHQRILIEAHRQQSENANHLGSLAEAIAQQFNNQLQVVIGNLDLLKISNENKSNKNLSDSMRAAMKAAELSAMLMAYLGETYGESLEKKVKHQAALAETLPRLLEGGKILVIEDEDMVRFITTSMLQHFNYKVIEANNGEQALQIFAQQKNQIRLVICDLSMPGMDGWQTLTNLRKLSSSLPIILASSYDEAIAMKGNHTEHPQAFLRKPFNSTSLQEAIRLALES